MQDGARPHRTAKVFDVLQEHFDSQVIALDYPTSTGIKMDWPPYSPDLNPCDFFLWGYLKDTVYGKNPTSLQELEQFIENTCVSIPSSILEKVAESFILRLRHIIVAEGQYFENIVT